MLEYLQKFEPDLVLLSTETLTDDDTKLLPQSWLDLLSLQQRQRVDRVIQQWDFLVSKLFETHFYLLQNLEEVHLAKSRRGLTMLYKIKTKNGESFYYEGRLPATDEDKASNQNGYAILPEQLQQFYTNVHNGWYYFSSRSMGFLPLENIFNLASEDWGILDSIGKQPLSLENTYAIFNSGMGGYLCIERDLTQPVADKVHSHLWFSKKAPNLNVEFWPVLDTWMCIGFEE
ncbi:hypothetical protein FLL45_20385 [Aliikangiella marina]|uniref:SMI1/KNR4 family protein n=1 Tax=Aliikangiella marina TaxID=1712262 RepID=A0A545T2S4_9GAMM|nr:SMI1/KNR4 family protein [Aliikangiella marina]TQV71512.1 hypothetical protein FLL45_20385 [Aliikangiella marina]